MDTRPNLFIVGAPKSGTAALSFFLGQHPDIFLPIVKELHQLGSDLIRDRDELKIVPHEYFGSDMSVYLSLYENARNEKWLCDASVMYLFSKKASEEIKKFCQGSKIITMLRNPVEVAYAMHAYNLWTCAEDVKDFGDALALEEERKRGRHIPRGCAMHDSLFYTDIGMYCSQVKRYIDYHGNENVHAIIYDDMRRDAAEVYRNTLRFLGVDKDCVSGRSQSGATP